jgi:hypothetical protein
MRQPSPANHYRADLLLPVLRSYEALTGRVLLARLHGESAGEYGLRAYEAPFVLLAHNGEADPRFVYANRRAQQVFERSWEDLVGLPSRYSAEPDERDARENLLMTVRRHGYCDDYGGVRVAASGRRFRIQGATVWNVLNEDGYRVGQAATFAEWSDITH